MILTKRQNQKINPEQKKLALLLGPCWPFFAEHISKLRAYFCNASNCSELTPVVE
jgi:hypothetical protein